MNLRSRTPVYYPGARLEQQATGVILHSQGDSLGKKFQQQKTKRLRQILLACQIALVGVALLLLGRGFNSHLIAMLLTAVALLCVNWAIAKQRIALGSWLLLGLLSTMLVYFSLYSIGLRSSVPLGFSGILIFAALLGSRRQLLFFLLVAITTCLGVGYLNHYGYYLVSLPHANAITGIVMAVLLSLIGFGALLLAEDYRRVLRNLERENARVSDANNHIEHLALHDALTNLPNRVMAQNNFHCLYHDCLSQGRKLGLIFIDLDNLKPINDSLGHQAGDFILKEVSRRLIEYTGDEGLCCRYGGDEFLVFLPNLQRDEDAADASGEILQVISQTYFYRDVELFCTCSIGIAQAPQDGDNLDEIIKKADIAMYHSKESGRNSFRFFSSHLHQGMVEQVNLISALRASLEGQQLALYYQPKIDLHNNRVVGFEALLRWRHPELGFIPPATFIPLAESSGLIIPIGEWVINEACRQARAWQQAGWEGFSIAVNVSSIQFKRGNIDSLVFNALTSTQLAPSFLELEITESLLIDDSERIAKTLSNLRAEGVHFSIDDFGTGYSNLGYLKKFEVEALKIDQSFVRKINDHLGDEAIVKAIIQMAASLGLKTIAEGVEDAQTVELLRSLGCTLGQGYHWAQPMPAADVEQFWRKWPAIRAAG